MGKRAHLNIRPAHRVAALMVILLAIAAAIVFALDYGEGHVSEDYAGEDYAYCNTVHINMDYYLVLFISMIICWVMSNLS